MNKAASRRRGFTLIELMLVVIIIGVLAAIVAPRFVGRDEDARIAATNASIINISMALDIFEMDMNDYPDSLDELMIDPESEHTWKGPYLKRAPAKDPWGNPYIYQRNTEEGGYRLCSKGPDRESSKDDICN